MLSQAKNDNLLSSRALWRADFHAFTLKLCSQFAREINCARVIAVNTNRFAAHIDIATFNGAHLAFAQHPQNSLGCLFWVVEQCVRSRAGNKPSVVQVIPIRKNFARNFHSCLSRRALHGAIRRRKKRINE